MITGADDATIKRIAEVVGIPFEEAKSITTLFLFLCEINERVLEKHKYNPEQRERFVDMLDEMVSVNTEGFQEKTEAERAELTKELIFAINVNAKTMGLSKDETLAACMTYFLRLTLTAKEKEYLKKYTELYNK